MPSNIDCSVKKVRNDELVYIKYLFLGKIFQHKDNLKKIFQLLLLSLLVIARVENALSLCLSTICPTTTTITTSTTTTYTTTTTITTTTTTTTSATNTTINNSLQPVATSPEEISQPTPLPVITPFPTTTSTTTTTTATILSRCELSYVDAQRIDNWSQGFVFSQVGADTATPACISNRLQEAWNECYNSLLSYQYANMDWDNCVVWKIFGAYQKSIGEYFINTTTPINMYGNPVYFGAQYDWAQFAQNNTLTDFHCSFNLTTVSYYCTLGYYYQYDSNSRLYIKQESDGTCKAVPAPADSNNACYAGTYYWFSSPISLLWDGQINLDEDLNIVQFPLDLRKSSTQWSTWRASSKAPLLVYDPEHKGVITSSTQLFGDWTFGGQRKASIHQEQVESTEFNGSVTPWSDGYQALAMLDKNGDKEIRADELAPLGLWFDENRNGISEPGEVKQLGNMGITALFYQPNRLEKETNSLYADKGYERKLGDKLIIGGSVDWRADTAIKKSELLSKHLSPALGCFKNNNAESSLKKGINNPSSTTSSIFNNSTVRNVNEIKNTGVAGIWKWSSNEKDIDVGGYFGFSEPSDSKLEGHVYSSFDVKDKAVGFSNIFSAIKFNGTKTEIGQDKIEIEFTIKPDETSVIESKAIFDKKTQTISGYSVAKVSIETKPLDLKYSWVAQRLEPTIK